jgi:hypothetical protein
MIKVKMKQKNNINKERNKKDQHHLVELDQKRIMKVMNNMKKELKRICKKLEINYGKRRIHGINVKVNQILNINFEEIENNKKY